MAFCRSILLFVLAGIALNYALTTNNAEWWLIAAVAWSGSADAMFVHCFRKDQESKCGERTDSASSEPLANEKKF